MENAVLRVEGMSCAHCVKSVTEAAQAVPGVTGVAVDLKGGLVSFSFDPAVSPLSQVAASITDAGYGVKIA